MRRPSHLLRFALVLLLLPATTVAAQTAQTPPEPYVPWSDSTAPKDVPQSSGPSLFSRVGTALGAALVGAGVGFFASQVVLGDWDEQDGNGRINRMRWAELGGAAGFTLGFSFPIGGRAGPLGGASLRPSGPGLGLPSGRSRITAEQISGSGASTAYDVVKNLRSEWLLRRLPHAWDTKEEADIKVYLDSQLLGGLDALKSISADNVSAMYRFSALQATTRWGAGHEEGAIMIVSKR